jgi:hypothetical protein
MMVKTMNYSKRIREKVNFFVSGLTGADQNIYFFLFFLKKKRIFRSNIVLYK